MLKEVTLNNGNELGDLIGLSLVDLSIVVFKEIS